MKKTLGMVLTCWVLLGTGRAAADEAEKLLDEAIRAHGGTAGLTRARQMLRTATGVAILPGGGESKISEKLLTDLPDRYRQELELGPQHILIVLNGNRAWQVTGGTTQEVGKEMLAEGREYAYALYLSTLIPARREKRFETKVVADAEVFGRKAAGLKVSCKGREDVRLYIDKKTGLLVKVNYSTVDAGLTVEKELFFSDHKDFNGVRLPTTVALFVNGKKFIDFKSASYTFPRQDEKSFAKP